MFQQNNLITDNSQKRGKIQSLSLKSYYNREVSKFFAFINFDDHISAKNAVETIIVKITLLKVDKVRIYCN